VRPYLKERKKTGREERGREGKKGKEDQDLSLPPMPLSYHTSSSISHFSSYSHHLELHFHGTF
jgi:hypothetical protein